MPAGTEMLPLIVGQIGSEEPFVETPVEDDVIETVVEVAEVVEEVPEPKPGHVR
jgi:hypothetical protein